MLYYFGAYYLVSYKYGVLHCEFPFAVIKEVLEGGAQKVDDHYVIVSLAPAPVDTRDSYSSLE